MVGFVEGFVALGGETGVFCFTDFDLRPNRDVLDVGNVAGESGVDVDPGVGTFCSVGTGRGFDKFKSVTTFVGFSEIGVSNHIGS